MSSGANQYIRSALHHAERPPPVQARHFYTSPIPIDDPLSPLPPSSQSSASTKQPPKPFSEYDNSSLEEAWHELRQQLSKYKQEQSEKRRDSEGSRTRDRASSLRDGRQRSGSASTQGTPRVKPARPAASSLSHVDDVESLEAASSPVFGSDSALPDTTGNPFVRAPSRTKVRALQREDRPARPKMQTHDTYEWDDTTHLAEHSPAPEVREEEKSPNAIVAVGVSRLHQVEMPELQMTPIYWTPVHDTAPVVRGTWFYQDTMLPVETNVANMLEAGYVDLRAWTETWKDELNSAVEVGAIGEMKILHKLWPDKPLKVADSRPSSRHAAGLMLGDDLVQAATSILINEPDTPQQRREKAVQAACDIIDIASGPIGVDNKAIGIPTYGYQGAIRTFSDFGVIYSSEREARLLKPSLQPSDYYGRRPLANYIRKGFKLGISVVRGFDQAAWDKLHPAKPSDKAQKAQQGAASSASGMPPNSRRKTDPEVAQHERSNVTDLVLVIHGIGQKIASRYESFHFTHAINSFRREVNVELGSKDVNGRLRGDMGGIMVLPVNWRHSLTFEEGGYQDDDPAANDFTLADITPETLTSVRNIVSDVLLDIPFYMSHHQPKMIAAVIREANRIYQLWCKNNPGFASTGRVHVIAHSLGSVMAVDILSRQPTTIPDHLSDPASIDLDRKQLDHFLFNTSNLFLAGSPAGFFLLLKKAQLLPRIDHPSISAVDDPVSNTLSICGERGQFGCLALDNIYNIINPYDPVAYRMNAAVDATYSASLRQANIPSASSSWFSRGTNSSTLFGGTSTSSSKTSRPPVLDRLPSNVEMEIHNFTREEVAEKRMFLLNDNGQIDFFLRYGGGAFDIQYLTMLSAHSSYWLLKDFVRMVVTETGREKGKEKTFPSMRAVKRKKDMS